MTPELQTILDRLDVLERDARNWKIVGLAALLLAAGAFAMPWLQGGARGTVAPARSGVVEANRFVLRDTDGLAVGGMEVNREGTIRLVLGSAARGAAFLEVQTDGVSHLTMRGPDGGVRAALLGTRAPALALSSGGASSAVVSAQESGAGRILLRDPLGKVRFEAP